MTLRAKGWVWGSLMGLAAIVIALGWSSRGAIRSRVQEQPFRTQVPSAQPARQFQQLPASATAPSAMVRGQDINLDVPFAPQAPFADWEQPYQDACEEATVIMVERYLRGALLSLAEMDAEILRMVEFQNQHYGFFKDSNVAETVRMTEEFFPHLVAQAVYDVTEEDIRSVLVRGAPVVVLVNGQRLGNPFYTAPGPERHTLVIKGVTGNTFITNDPGTKRGADFVYPIATVLNAMVDYDGGTPGTGKKAMIVLRLRS